jgi:hypothetical protein
MTNSSPRDVILHRRSRVKNKRPLTTDIQWGEIAVNFNEEDPSVYIKDESNKVRKVGGIFYSDVAPDPSVAIDGFPELSHGELWVKRINPPEASSDQDEDAHLYVYNKFINSGGGGWLEIGKFRFALIEESLDQFRDGADGDDIVHTDGNQILINNKSVIKGESTAGGNKVIINDGANFATAVINASSNVIINSSDIDVNADNVVLSSATSYIFQTDSVTGTGSSTFTYNDHGLFNGEEIFVEELLNDNSTPGGLTSGNYKISNTTLNTFKLNNGSTDVLASGNVRIKYSPKLILDQDYNILQSGNFEVKGLGDFPDTSQITDGRWDIYQNTQNGNVRIYSRTGTNISEIVGSSVTIDVKNSTGSVINAWTPVYFVGFDPINNVITIGPADASSSLTMKALGLASASIPANGLGVVTVYGELKVGDSFAIDSNPPGSDESGNVVYVKSGGGLTFLPPTKAQGQRQPIGLLLKESVADPNGRIFVNHPDIDNQVQLKQGYIFVGSTGDHSTAYRLDTNFFQTYVAGDTELEISVADEITFGAYSLLWDGNSGSKTQTKVSTSDEGIGNTQQTTIDSFPATYRSAKFFVQIALGGAGIPANYQITELLIVHNGTDVDLVDYGTASTLNQRLGDFTANIVGNNVEIYFQRYAATLGQVQIKTIRTAVLS